MSNIIEYEDFMVGDLMENLINGNLFVVIFKSKTSLELFQLTETKNKFGLIGFPIGHICHIRMDVYKRYNYITQSWKNYFKKL